jgi:spore photoproduct lyase
MRPYIPRKLFIEENCRDSPITRNVLAALRGTPVEFIRSAEEKVEESKRLSPALAGAKKSLILARFKGRFFKACPGQQSRGDTRNVCCDYFVINFASNCHMECTYCYLQSYLNFPYLIVYANLDDLLDELKAAFAAHPERRIRIGTGELADSLALDPLTGYSRYLVDFFARQPNAVLELKTKSDCVDNLLDLDHRCRTVVAWSVNPEFIQRREEHKTATMRQRLDAAARCVAAGYPVAFHFDPLIHYPGWEKGYERLVRDIFAGIPASAVAWISLGGLRMTPAQRELMKERFPRSILPYGELIPAEDGKLRYFKPLRTELYRRLLDWIEDRGPGVKVYACMERPEVWDKSFGTRPDSDSALGDYLVQMTGG